MCSHLVRFGLTVALLSALGGPACAAAADTLGEVALTDTDGWTQVSIGLPTDTRYDVFSLADPDRLVVDLHQTRLPENFQAPGPNGIVANVRTGQPVPGDVRLVFELGGKVRPKAELRHMGGQTRLLIQMRDRPTRATARASAPSGADSVRGSARIDSNAVLARSGSPRTDSAGSPRTDSAGSPRTDANVDLAPAGSPRTELTGSPRRDASNWPEGNASAPVGGEQSRRGSSRIDSNAVLARSGSPRTVADGSGQGSALAAASAGHPDATLLTPAGAVESEPKAAAPSRPVAASVDPAQPAVATDESAHAPPPPPGARTVRDVLGTHLRPIVIAVDAGHGGQDVGAKGFSGTYEKNITLATARELAREIDAVPGMKAVLTRDGDYFVPLADRYRKAREAKADLFISVHADADPTHTASGSSVWVLSERGVTSQAARWLADRENAADLVGGVKLSDKDDTLASVLLNLSQSATMKASEDAADRVHQALRDIGRTHKSHPEHANFVVLRSPDVPSMLVETAFITNPEEERHLNDPAYRARLAHAVLSGVESYFINTPLPGTQFAALHPRGSRDLPIAAAAPSRTLDGATDPSAGGAPAPVADMPAPAARAPVLLATADDGRSVHVVQRGESLRDIAEHFGVSLQRLRQINALHGNQVRAGQRLRIPARSDNG
ncbi:MAG: N-acetylmuramoyl-L-alanine amidase [Proteobacteria bacterium]|nr:N-acetylmuramoyl-L-alanine amidase [Pseudomonadota bacterium]